MSKAISNIKKLKPFLNTGVGEQIKEYMELNNWPLEVMASKVGISPELLESILQNKQQITVELAELLSKAFCHSSEFWLTLDANYRSKL